MLEEKNAVIPDSLKQFSHIAVPLKRLLRQQPTFLL
jgi:hypothetical protein